MSGHTIWWPADLGAENRLISASGAGNSASYSYDAQGRRKTKTVNGAKTVFVTDADNREVLEYDGTSGAIQRWYAYGPGSNDVLNQTNVVAGTRAALIPDIQGSIIASLDSGSGNLSKFGYLPYGKSAGAKAPFGYTAQRVDPETNGLYYYRARHYSPLLGRFIQADPIGYSGGSNLYAYVDNDPLNLLDPFGLSPDSPLTTWASELALPGFRAAGNILSGAAIGAGAATAASAILLATTTRTADRAQDELRVTVYRVVDPIELAHLQATGNYGSRPSESGKYFALTATGAQAFASAPVNSGTTITSTTLPQVIISQGYQFVDPGPKGPGASVFYAQPQLPSV